MAKFKGLCSAPRFAHLCAAMSLISKHAPKARPEACRILSIQYGDKDVAERMMKTVRVVIVPRDKQMTELEEFRTLATSDSGKGPGKTFDGRQWAHTRGVGDVVVGSIHYAAITEENLLGGAPDAAVYGAPKDPDGKAIAGGDGRHGGGRLHARLLDHHARVRAHHPPPRARRHGQGDDHHGLHGQARGDRGQGQDRDRALGRRPAHQPEVTGAWVSAG